MANARPRGLRIWYSDLWTGTSKNVLKLLFVVARVSWPLFCFRCPYCIFKTGLDSNPESCHSKQVRNLQMRNEPKNLRICDLPTNKKNYRAPRLPVAKCIVPDWGIKLTPPGYILFFLPVVFDSEVVKNEKVKFRSNL